MIIKTAPVSVGPMNKAQATALTKRIRQHIDSAWEDITKAYEGKAWKAMGYGSWEAYVKAEFNMGRSRSYQLLDQGRIIAGISEAAGEVSTVVDISEREARELKADLPAIKDEVRSRVEAGEDPKKAADETVAAKLAEKEKAKADKAANQAKNDAYRDQNRAALSGPVKAQQQAKEKAKASKKPAALPPEDHLAELEEANRVLAAENVDLKARVKKFSEMEVEYQKGGFDEVLRGKDEVIAALKTRVERESMDKASWKKSSDMWRKRAEESGWSNDIAIDIETGAVGRA